tara:strand:- start:3293 stop:3781 length:489 start_codon:yes stop_codon:yes gene_type:complete
MKQKWNKSWTGSKQPRKQRKYRFNAPLHIKQRFLHVSLSPTLRKRYGKRQIRVRTGDSIKVLRGQFKGKAGKVERVSVKRTRAYITGIEHLKKDGSKSLYPLQPSNLQIQELDLSDKLRRKRLGAEKEGGSVKKAVPKKEGKEAVKVVKTEGKKEVKQEAKS